MHHPPFRTVRAPNHLVASADHVATSAGVEMFARGGNAVDAAIACNAAMTVVGPHLCGMGGDLFALVHVDGEVHALNASGRAGSGASAAALRDRGLAEMPFRHDIASVTVPGCVDGWMALYERFSSLPLSVILGPAQRLAADGFAASGPLAHTAGRLDARSQEQLHEIVSQATHTGARVRRPGVALALAGIIASGRRSFYEGAFGSGLLDLGGGLFAERDLELSQADWQESLHTEAFGVGLHTVGPNSQGYLALGAARLASRLELPDDTDDAHWAHQLIEASIAAGHDRPSVLHERADGDELLAQIDQRLDLIDTERASGRTAPASDGDTTYLCTAGNLPDGRSMGVSLIQSNASGFGSHLVEPTTGINLHNRGMGFSLADDHPAVFAPGARPPHTLSPLIATTPEGDLAAVLGTMGGDAQPQILLQVAARLFHHGQSPGRAIASGRWALHGPETGFDTWSAPSCGVNVEGHAASTWLDGLATRGHAASNTPPWDSGFGHAHAIIAGPDKTWAGAADPRCIVGSCAGG